jgi:EAL domain-containing protein (putative c-di-GMP-specific phosphodiesterase class I)
MSLLQRTIGRLAGPAAPEVSAQAKEELADVIIVDDSSGVQNIIGTVVSKAGLKPAFGSSLEHVVKMDLRGSNNLILLDLALERSDAFDVLKHLSEIGFAGPIVPMSGQDLSILKFVAVFGRQLQLDMMPALHKPFRVDQLRLIVAKYIESRSRAVRVDIETAISDGSLQVWYTPRVDLASYRMFGFQASPRIMHPTAGLLHPDQFLDEDSNAQMSKLAGHVVRKTVDAWKRLGTAMLRPVVSMSARELVNPLLVDVLKEIRPDDHRWPGMTLDLADSGFLVESEVARQALVRLRLHQVQIGVDDPLALIRLAAYSEIKISELVLRKSFVLGCAHDGEKRSYCKEFAARAKRMQIRLIAHGVETMDDLDFLQSIEVKFAQGNLFSPAIQFSDLRRKVEDNAPLWGRDA